MAKKAAKKGPRRKSTCLKPKECRITVARLDYNAARGCSAKKEAADEFRKVAAKAANGASKPVKTKLYKESLRKIVSAYRACGQESEAREAIRREEAEQARFNGIRRGRRR